MGFTGSGSDGGTSSQPNDDLQIDADVSPCPKARSLLGLLTVMQHDIGRDDDVDSTLGSEASSLRSVSLSSSIYNYRYENGRRYHGYRDGRYFLPNDEAEQVSRFLGQESNWSSSGLLRVFNNEAEQDRLDFHHHLWRLMISGKLFNAPISNPQRVLDLGTGTGIWSIDFADEFPSALVIGTDLSPIQPSAVPSNCKFYVDDMESEWTFNPEEAFDFIHGRALAGSIANFDLLFRRIYENLKPGGWVEMQEFQSTIYSDDDPLLLKAPNTKKWSLSCCEAVEKAGFFGPIAEVQRQKLINAGFTDVHEDVYKVCLMSD
jgi:SAM-dependent methyltransferase